MSGFRFSKFIPGDEGSLFDRLLKLFLELVTYTSGDVDEALSWMNELDRQHNLTGDDYGMGDFIEDLKRHGYISEPQEGSEIALTARAEKSIRSNALNEIFGKLRKGGRGEHRTSYSGSGDELNSDVRPYEFGDPHSSIDMTMSLRNAQQNHGIDEFALDESDLQVRESDHHTQHSTVLMIDISHSMILYGEDRITPAKKVAMALAELIERRYPKDTLDIIVFGNEAWPVQLKDLPYLQVGPYHTNTVAGIELAMDILRRRKTANKQIFMITDGKPTCMKIGNSYYQNSMGLDRKILNKCYNMAAHCKKLKIPITTFMIASDPYLQQFVREFTRINMGRAFYSSLTGLGEFIFEDFIKNRKKKVR